MRNIIIVMRNLILGVMMMVVGMAAAQENGGATGTYQVAQAMLAATKPQCAFNPDMAASEFDAWQQSVSDAMATLMCHPTMPEHISAQCVSRQQMRGYVREHWQFFPMLGCKVSFIVLKPDGITQPTPAVMCIPGSGMTMEAICDTVPSRRNWAEQIVKEGFIAVAVENACAGTQQDEGLAPGSFDYNTPSRILLELGWSWLGYTSYCQRQVLQWMREQSEIRADRICVAGFSLGTEPLMVLGALEKDIYAFVYNDFLCNTQERAIVLTKDNDQHARPFPNSIRHLIPNWWRYFNFPDVVASLAPRYLIMTEGGLDRDFNLVRRAYELSGHPERLEQHHYPKYTDPASRSALTVLPRDIDRDTFYRLANVDGPNHYFKSHLILPWLTTILRQ